MNFCFRTFPRRTRRSSAHALAIEALDPRVLLSITWSSRPTALIVSGDAAANVISVGVNPAGNFRVNGTDTLISAAGRNSVSVYGGGGHDSLTLEASLATRNGYLFGGDGSDTLVALNRGNNYLRGNLGRDSYQGGLGRDTFIIDQYDKSFTELGGASDSILATDATAGINLALGAVGIERITGSAYADVIDATGETVNVVLSGNAGDDVLTGGLRNDTLLGGEGDDILTGGLGSDALRGDQGNDSLLGGAGIDTADYRPAPGGVTVNLLLGRVSGADSDGLLTEIENIIGSEFGDTLIGNGGINTIQGQGGDDLIEGGGAADVLQGDGGEDTLSYASSPTAVVVNLTTWKALSGDANGDRIAGFVHIIGSAFADNLRGNASVNRIQGGAGADRIDGEGGADLIDGGADNDVVIADSEDDDSGTLTGGAGSDRLIAKSITTPVDWVLASDAGFEVIDGSDENDVIDVSAYPATVGVTVSGYGGDDLLIGGAGPDNLNGQDGNDTISGGLGVDVLRGGAGDDTLYGGTPAVPDDGVADSIRGEDGNDRVYGVTAGPIGGGGALFLGDTTTRVEQVFV